MKIGRNKLFNIPQTNQLLKHQKYSYHKTNNSHYRFRIRKKLNFRNRHNLLRVGLK
jgi:hypothetical protein